MSGSEDRGGGDNSIQFINFGRVGDKSFREWQQKYEGGRVGDNAPAEKLELDSTRGRFTNSASDRIGRLVLCF